MSLVFSIGLATAAWSADESDDDPWRVSGTLVTDDVEHGFSRTLGDPGVQAWIAYSDPRGWYGGIRVKTIDFVSLGLPDRDLYVSLRGFIGYEWKLAEPWSVRLSGHLINLPGSNLEDETYEELFAEVFYGELISFKIDYGHDRYTLPEDSLVYELNGRYPLGRGFAIEAQYGFHDADELLGDSYSYYSLGASKRFGPFEVALTYHATDSNGDRLFESIGAGLGLQNLTDAEWVLSFQSRSDVYNRPEWERWPGYQGFSSSVDIVSNYVSKGVSQTEDNPAVQLSVDYSWNNGVYTGVWVSNVDYVPTGQPNDGADFEVDIYLGYSWEPWEGWGLDVSYVYYDYPGIEQTIEGDFDYGEWIVGASHKNWGLQVGYSNDQVASGEDGTWYKGTGAFDLADKLSLSIEVGHFDRSNFGNSYNWWGIGVAYDIGRFDVGLQATQTSSAAQRDNPDGQADDHLVFSLSYAF